MLKLVFKDGTDIELVDASMAKHFTVNCESREEYIAIWEKFTPENLLEVKIKSDDTVIQTIRNMILMGTQTTEFNGAITAHFYTDGGEFVIDEYAEAGRILLGEE